MQFLNFRGKKCNNKFSSAMQKFNFIESTLGSYEEGDHAISIGSPIKVDMSKSVRAR